MSIARRTNGRFIVKYKDEKGKWRQRSFSSEAEARRFDAETAYDKTENSRLTLAEAVLVFLKNTSRVPKSVQSYRFIICGNDRKNGSHREGPAEILADRYADSLTRRDLETVRETCRRDGMGIATTNFVIGKIKAALSWCVEQDLLSENPWAKYRNLPGRQIKHRTGTLEDFLKVYPALPAWMQWASKTALALCLRPGISELFSIKWDVFDWQAKTAKVYMPKVKRMKVVYPPSAYLAEAQERYERDKAHGYALVCRNRRNLPVAEAAYKSAWRCACEKAGVRMPMYALRHIAASQMLAAGTDLATIAAQLGHKDITTTGAFYTHALASAQRLAAETLPDLVRIGAK